MPSLIQCLHRGLQERCSRSKDAQITESAYLLGYLEQGVTFMFEGTPAARKKARADLEKMIGRGRCLLHATEFIKREAAAVEKEFSKQAEGGTQNA